MRRQSLLLGSVPLLALLLWGFAPFTQVTNVCPTCPAAKTDVVVFNNGYRAACTVVAQNTDYYVLQKNGEYRSAFKSLVSKVEWKDARGAASLGTGDQILTKNNVLYHGTIVEAQAGRYFVIQVGSLRHTIWNSQLYSVHRAGERQAFTVKGGAAAPAKGAKPTAPATTTR